MPAVSASRGPQSRFREAAAEKVYRGFSDLSSCILFMRRRGRELARLRRSSKTTAREAKLYDCQ